MRSIYDKLIDNLKSYALPYEDHPQVSTRDFEYDHPLTGIENDPIVNIDGSTFNINTIEEDLSLDEIEKIYNKLYDASNLNYMREYDEEPGGRHKELFTYYKGKKSPYEGKKLPRTSSVHLRNLKNQVHHILYELKAKRKEQEANDLLPILEKFLEIHKKGNPKLYPDWLKLNFKEIKWGDLYIQPVINIEKLLESGDDIRIAKKTRDFVSNIWGRLVNADSRTYKSRQQSVGVKTTYVLFEDFNSYMKNIVNKKIKPEIKNLPRGKECVHSIIFRYRKNIDDIQIQIHPRYKRDCTDSYWNRFDTYEFGREIKGILATYGWVEGVNYETSTYRD